jgi:hypothetical protein
VSVQPPPTSPAAATITHPIHTQKNAASTSTDCQTHIHAQQQQPSEEDPAVLDRESRLEEMRKVSEQNHTRQDVLDMIDRINKCKFLPRPSYRREALVRACVCVRTSAFMYGCVCVCACAWVDGERDRCAANVQQRALSQQQVSGRVICFGAVGRRAAPRFIGRLQCCVCSFVAD